MYAPIAKVTVGSGGAASISFSNIPQTYTDLLIISSCRSVSAGAFSDELMKFNGSSSNFVNKYIYANGSNAYRGADAYGQGFVAGMPGATNTSYTFSNKLIYIFNYTSSTYKSYHVDNAAEQNNTTAYLHVLGGLWSSGAAITSITFTTDNGSNYDQYSTATLYGIKQS